MGNGMGLGFRRLSIIDLTGGRQPMSNEDQTVTVVFNGEIYNFVELRADLKQQGHTFRTSSDTEVIVHGYAAWGDDVVHHLNGMFAFAVWDSRRRKLLLSPGPSGHQTFILYPEGRHPGLCLGNQEPASAPRV